MPKPRQDGDDYTLQEFADKRRVSLSTIKNLIKAGELEKTYVSPGTVVITHAEAERFMASRERVGA